METTIPATAEGVTGAANMGAAANSPHWFGVQRRARKTMEMAEELIEDVLRTDQVEHLEGRLDEFEAVLAEAKRTGLPNGHFRAMLNNVRRQLKQKWW